MSAAATARAWLLAPLLTAALAGCTEEPDRFPVVINVLSDEGKPFPGVPVTLGKSPAGVTDAEGHLRARVTGKEGQKINVSIEVPKGYRLSSSAQPMVLRHLNDIESGGKRALPVEHTLKLSPLERQYAVLVRAGVAGLPVEVFGSQRAITNDKGVAMFLYNGSPGDELQVKLSTANRPDLRPQNPTSSFLLAQKAEAYVVREKFAVFKAPTKHVAKPKHVGPKKL